MQNLYLGCPNSTYVCLQDYTTFTVQPNSHLFHGAFSDSHIKCGFSLLSILLKATNLCFHTCLSSFLIVTFIQASSLYQFIIFLMSEPRLNCLCINYSVHLSIFNMVGVYYLTWEQEWRTIRYKSVLSRIVRVLYMKYRT